MNSKVNERDAFHGHQKQLTAFSDFPILPASVFQIVFVATSHLNAQIFFQSISQGLSSRFRVFHVTRNNVVAEFRDGKTGRNTNLSPAVRQAKVMIFLLKERKRAKPKGSCQSTVPTCQLFKKNVQWFNVLVFRSTTTAAATSVVRGHEAFVDGVSSEYVHRPSFVHFDFMFRYARTLTNH